jgi:carboxypeptidase T
MKKLMVVLFCLVAWVAGTAAFAGPGDLLVRLQLSDYPVQMRQLQSKSIDVAGVDFPKKQVDLLVSPNELTWLKSQGYRIVSLEMSRSRMAPDSRYQNPEKIAGVLKQYAALYPTLAKVQSIGKSLQGRDIWAIRLTRDVGVENPAKPHVFFNAMHHAREVMTSEVALDIIETLLSQYGKDPQITRWMDSFVIDVVPMFNVDGNNLVWSQEPMWRKNARGGYGVDINRNYPYAWNSCRGSSSYRDAQDFHGDSAGSEPETQVMMNFVKQIQPVFSISYHSYSEIVIYPYGCKGQRTETREVVEKIGKELAGLLKRDDGRGSYTAGTAPELLYSVDGGDIDWLYAVGGVIPYVIEVNANTQGFQPSYAKWRDLTVKNQQPGWKYLLSRMEGSSIYGQVTNQNGQPLEGARLRLRQVGGSFSQVVSVKSKGFFQVILNPGNYEVIVEADGYPPTSSQQVKVESARVPLRFALFKR